MAQCVYIIRNEERHIIDVYQTREDAEARIALEAAACVEDPVGSEEWQYFYDMYEILRLPLL